MLFWQDSIYVWNPNVFTCNRPCFGRAKAKNRRQKSSRCIYIFIDTYEYIPGLPIKSRSLLVVHSCVIRFSGTKILGDLIQHIDIEQTRIGKLISLEKANIITGTKTYPEQKQSSKPYSLVFFLFGARCLFFFKATKNAKISGLWGPVKYETRQSRRLLGGSSHLVNG